MSFTMVANGETAFRAEFLAAVPGVPTGQKCKQRRALSPYSHLNAGGGNNLLVSLGKKFHDNISALFLPTFSERKVELGISGFK